MIRSVQVIINVFHRIFANRIIIRNIYISVFYFNIFTIFFFKIRNNFLSFVYLALYI